MATIRTGIELQDNFTGILDNIINAVNISVSAMEQMQRTLDLPVDTASIQGIREQLAEATIAAREMDEAMQQVESPAIDQPETQIQWQSDNLEVFTGTGIERFEQEIQSANGMLSTLNSTQARIAAQAAQTEIFPANMVSDLGNMQTRIQAIQERIQAIESNPLNLGSETANAEIERLRASLDQMISDQEALNNAVENMDVSAANDAYLHLSQTVSGTERYIRDNVNEQGCFNREIKEGTGIADNLKNKIAGVLSAYVGIAGIRKAFSFIEDCTEAFNTQLNAENQLMVVLGNMLDEDYVSQFELKVTADTTQAVDEINAIQDSVDDVTIGVSAETQALQAEFDAITEKAAEIQSNGIYGDEAMIAGAAEFATYFTDVDAITTMMDTLADYAMGMSGGGEIDSTAMVDYATNLGKIMSGSYDAMTKKGFEFSDAQKAIIEGTATQEQLIATLGDDYATMSEEMQAAAVISQIIEESWGGLYETMSNTPEGKIIQLTNAWGDMKEVVGKQLYPYVLLFVNAINENWGTIEGVVQGITGALQFMLGVLSWLLEGALNFAQVVIDNWSWISPIIYGVAAALAVYYGASLLAKDGSEKSALAAAKDVIAKASQAISTFAATAAQEGLNAAIASCPITWIIIAIIALIAVIFALCSWIADLTGITESGFGLICGIVAVAAAFILNQFIGLANEVITVAINFYNMFANFAAALGIIFDDPIAAAKATLLSLFEFVVSVVSKAASLLDAIFGSNLTDTISAFQDKIQAEIDATIENAGGEAAETLDPSDYTLDRLDYEDAFNAGAAWGDGISNDLSDLFGTDDLFSPEDLFGTDNIPSMEDYTGDLTGGVGGIGDDISDIAENTSDISDSLDITSEDLKYLRDIAEQETINRFTTAEINIEQTNHNNVSGGMDLDGVVNGLTDVVKEAAYILTEGVHT